MLSSTLKIRRRALIWYIERLRASDIGYYLAAVSAPYWSGNCHDLMDLSLWSDWDQGGEWIWGARANPVRNLAGPTKWPPFAIASSSLFISLHLMHHRPPDHLHHKSEARTTESDVYTDFELIIQPVSHLQRPHNTKVRVITCFRLHDDICQYLHVGRPYECSGL